ncbi:MAG: laccase domain-containing protein, partial [Deltaproteobacteria bacterium]
FKVFNAPPHFNLKKIEQVHGTKIVQADKGFDEADGLIGVKDNLAILTADCMPILLLGNKGQALVHAGWRGLKNGILKEDCLQNLTVSEIFIGPHIKSCCYEITVEFLDNFPRQFFMKRKEKYFFSLREVAMLQLRQVFGDIKIWGSEKCTHCDHSFHSYRRDQTVKRNWNVWIPNIVDTLHTSR